MNRPARLNRSFCGLTFGALATLGTGVSASGQSLTGLGHLPSATSSFAMGVSADGLVVVGLSDRAFRWSRTGGMQDLGTLPLGITSQATAASSTGDFITGFGDGGPFITA